MVDSLLESAPTRRETQRAALRQAILDAAQHIARDEGWGAVTIRKVADSIGYSHPTLYAFFEDKQALLLALHCEGFRQLEQTLSVARARAGDPAEAPFAMAQAYCNFAWQHRELYEVMHSLGGAQLDPLTLTDEAQAVLTQARHTLEDWAKNAGVRIANPDDAVLLVWSALHGIASLALSKQMPGGKKHAAMLARDIVRNLLGTWGSQALP
jgi:AcrR family transcriptional regulator